MASINKLETEDQVLYIGRQGENNVVTLTFDLSAFKTAYGAGMAYLIYKSSGDERPYMPETTFTAANSTLSWTVTSADTYYSGNGHAEIRWLTTTGDVLKKSAILNTTVVESIMDSNVERPGKIVYLGDGSNMVTYDYLAEYDEALKAAMLSSYVEADASTWGEDSAEFKKTEDDVEHSVVVPTKTYVDGLNEAMDGAKIDVPLVSGEAAQVLATDGSGGYYWKTVIASDGSGTATVKDYDELANKPSVGGRTLQGALAANDIGAAAKAHTHVRADITDFPDALKNPYYLRFNINGTADAVKYDGSEEKTISINYPRLIREITLPTYAEAIADTTSGITWITSNGVVVGCIFDTDSDGNAFVGKSVRVMSDGSCCTVNTSGSYYEPTFRVGLNATQSEISSSSDSTSGKYICIKGFCSKLFMASEYNPDFGQIIAETSIYSLKNSIEPKGDYENGYVYRAAFPATCNNFTTVSFFAKANGSQTWLNAGTTIKIWIEE